MHTSTSEIWSSPAVQTLFARTPPAPLSPKAVWRQDLTAPINELLTSVNVRASERIIDQNRISVKCK